MDTKYERVHLGKDVQEKVEVGGPVVNVWRGINAFMMIFFLLAALVNINDGDWYLWIPIYLIPAILCLPIIVKPSLSENAILGGISVIHFTLCLVYSVYQVIIMVEAIRGKLVNPLQHEEGREMGGLLIIITWLGISRFTSLGRPHAASSNRSMMNALIMVSITLALVPMFTWGLCFIGDWHQRLGHCKDMFIN